MTPHSLGIAVAQLAFGQVFPDRYSVIIPRNTTIPTSRSEIYSALAPDQTTIKIEIYQGDQAALAERSEALIDLLYELED